MGKEPIGKLPGGKHHLSPTQVAGIQRRRLLDAMASVTAESGYPNTTVRKLLGRAGISRITFYALFKDKEECFLAAFDEVAERMLTRVAEAYRRGSDPEDGIERAFAQFAACCAEEPEQARMCIVEALAAGPEARARRAATIDRLTKLIEVSVYDLRPDAELPALAPRALVGGMEELVYGAVERGEAARLPRLVDEILATHLTLVRAL